MQPDEADDGSRSYERKPGWTEPGVIATLFPGESIVGSDGRVVCTVTADGRLRHATRTAS